MKELSPRKGRPRSTERVCNLSLEGRTFCIFPLDDLFEELGKRWTLLVIAALGSGVARFQRLERELPGISPRTLSERLKTLERLGIVRRVVFPENPPRVEYTLTAEGRRLLKALLPLLEWVDQRARL